MIDAVRNIGLSSDDYTKVVNALIAYKEIKNFILHPRT
jgi:hypothetical protein